MINALLASLSDLQCNRNGVVPSSLDCDVKPLSGKLELDLRFHGVDAGGGETMLLLLVLLEHFFVPGSNTDESLLLLLLLWFLPIGQDMVDCSSGREPQNNKLSSVATTVDISPQATR